MPLLLPSPALPPSLPTDIPTLAAADLPAGDKPLLLPLHLPGFDLRVLDQRKSVSLDTAGGKVEVRLPIYFYFPADEQREALRLLRDTADDLRRACHVPDRSDVDLDNLLARFERGLAMLGQR